MASRLKSVFDCNVAGIAELYHSDFNPSFRQTGYAQRSDKTLYCSSPSTRRKWRLGKDYVDAFESPTTFTWSSQSRSSPESKSGREVLNSLETGMRLHLWVRGDMSMCDFEYCGWIAPISHEGSNPMQVRFRLLTPVTPEAWARFRSE